MQCIAEWAECQGRWQYHVPGQMVLGKTFSSDQGFFYMVAFRGFHFSGHAPKFALAKSRVELYVEQHFHIKPKRGVCV